MSVTVPLVDAFEERLRNTSNPEELLSLFSQVKTHLIEAQRKQITELTDVVCHQNETIVQLTERVKLLERQVKNLQLPNSEDDIPKNRWKTLNKTISDLQQKVKALTISNDTLQTNIASTNRELINTQSICQKHFATIRQNEDKINLLYNEITTLQALITHPQQHQLIDAFSVRGVKRIKCDHCHSKVSSNLVCATCPDKPGLHEKCFQLYCHNTNVHFVHPKEKMLLEFK